LTISVNMFIDINRGRCLAQLPEMGSEVKIVIAGGSGFLGTTLARAFVQRGDDVAVLTRRPHAGMWRSVRWDGESLGPWADEVEGADAVINLAGRSVHCRYNERNRREIIDSRVRSTRAVAAAIARAARPPRVWLQASTATLYAHRYDAPNDELTGVIGGAEPDAPSAWRFSIDVARAWESALAEAATGRTRKVAMRMAMVMGTDPRSGFSILRRLAALGLGGRAGDGRQFMSWVHEGDFVRSVDWLIAHEHLAGAVNITSPFPLGNADFMRTLRRAAGASLGLPATTWMVELGSFLMRTESELILKSRRVVPTRLLRSGFTFRFASWEDAARDLCARVEREDATVAA